MVSVTIIRMGEYNDPAPAAEAIEGDVAEYLAKYLYDRYETEPHPMRDDDPRNNYIGATEPWESAGKRMREKWFAEAQYLAVHFAILLVGTDCGLGR